MRQQMFDIESVVYGEHPLSSAHVLEIDALFCDLTDLISWVKNYTNCVETAIHLISLITIFCTLSN